MLLWETHTPGPLNDHPKILFSKLKKVPLLRSSSRALWGGGVEMLSDLSRSMSGTPLERQNPSKNPPKLLRSPFRGFCVQGSLKRSPTLAMPQECPKISAKKRAWYEPRTYNKGTFVSQGSCCEVLPRVCRGTVPGAAPFPPKLLRKHTWYQAGRHVWVQGTFGKSRSKWTESKRDRDRYREREKKEREGEHARVREAERERERVRVRGSEWEWEW